MVRKFYSNKPNRKTADYAYREVCFKEAAFLYGTGSVEETIGVLAGLGLEKIAEEIILRDIV
jgi:hypothetical protein